MKTGRGTWCWLRLALVGGTLALMGPTEAGKPAGSPKSAPYVAVDLGGLASAEGFAPYTQALDINDAGQVVGTTGPGSQENEPFLLDPRDTNGDGRPDTWFVDEVRNADGAPGPDGQNDLIIGLGNLASDVVGRATAVNDLGVVVGTSGYLPFIVVPREPASWYEDSDGDGLNDLMLPLGSLPGEQDSWAGGLHINNLGQVIGYFSIASSRRGFLLNPEVDALGVVHWFRDGGNGVNALMVDLGSFIPYGIDDSGRIAGTSGWGGPAMLRNPVDGSLIELGGAGYPTINDHGQIGLSFQPDSTTWHAGLLTPEDTNGDGLPDSWFRDLDGDDFNDLILDLGTVDRLDNSGVNGLSNVGSVVGRSYTTPLPRLRGGSKYVPYLWKNGVIRSLYDLTGGAVTFWEVYGLNDAGQIVCTDGVVAYILIPAP